MRIIFITLIALLAIMFPTTAQATQVVPPPVNPPGIVEGERPSPYTGRYYIPQQEPYRKCVAHREGRHQYWTTGSNGFYLGTYQMTHDLARGAVWMMTPELKSMYGPERGRQIRDLLFRTKPTQWNRFYWDMAFYTVLNWEHPFSGKHHWSAQRGACE